MLDHQAKLRAAIKRLMQAARSCNVEVTIPRQDVELLLCLITPRLPF